MRPQHDPPWWRPYIMMLLFAAVSGLVVVAFVAANWTEVSRLFRP